jgi:hypothetical protein
MYYRKTVHLSCLLFTDSETNEEHFTRQNEKKRSYAELYVCGRKTFLLPDRKIKPVKITILAPLDFPR